MKGKIKVGFFSNIIFGKGGGVKLVEWTVSAEIFFFKVMLIKKAIFTYLKVIKHF